MYIKYQIIDLLVFKVLKQIYNFATWCGFILMELIEAIKELHQLTLSFCNKGKSNISFRHEFMWTSSR